MKLTDFGILFVCIAMCVFLNLHTNQQLLEEQVYGNTMTNNIVDNIAQDAMRQSYYFEGNQLRVDKDRLLRFVTEEMAVEYMGEGKNYAKYLQKNIKLILLTFPDGFYVGSQKGESSFTWSDKLLYEEGKMTDGEHRANHILKVAKEYGVELYLPNGEKTGLLNEISDYQLLLVYDSYPYVWQGKEYKKLILSGAKLNYHMIFDKNGE